VERKPSGLRGVAVRLRFGSCTFDSQTRELLRDGKAVTVSPRAFSLLELLLGESPRPVSKTDLVRKLWNDSTGSETGLAAAILELKGVIEEKGEQPFLKRVGGDGYAFVGRVETDRRPTVPGGYKFKAIWDDREIPLAEGENLIGRDYDALIRIDSPKISRRHARITIEGERVWLEDLGSRNGTLLNEKPVKRRIRLGDGDRIGFGSYLIVFRRADG
jgi:DNA-binding winged helix-turn-helix (wHTH) protein